MTTKPVNTWKRKNGSTVNVFATDKPYVFRVTVDGKPFIDKLRRSGARVKSKK